MSLWQQVQDDDEIQEIREEDEKMKLVANHQVIVCPCSDFYITFCSPSLIDQVLLPDVY